MAALAFALTLACGSGGGYAPLPAIEIALDFGVVRADVSTTRIFQIVNPFPKEAHVELLEEPEGLFAPDDDALLATVGAGANLDLPVVLTAPGVGEQSGEFTLRFIGADGRGVQDVVISLAAEAEPPVLQLQGAVTVEFGDVLIGESRVGQVQAVNPTAVTPIEITGVAGLPPGFSLAGALPATILPGGARIFDLTYEPTQLVTHDFELVLVHTGEGEPLRFRVTAETTTWIPEIVVDLGSVAVTSFTTGWLEVDVPAHAISFSIEARSPKSEVIGLLGLEGPDGTVYENATATGAFLWTPGEEGLFTATLPQSDREESQLDEGGGIYRFRLQAFASTTGSFDVRVILHNRPDGLVTDGVLDLNVFLAPGLQIPAASAPSHPRLQDILTEADRVFSQQGLRVGDVDYYELGDPRYDQVNQFEFHDLLEESSVATNVRMNLFFVLRTLSDGVLGVAPRVPGPALNGTGLSGVMVDFDYGSAATVARVTAHELGHYLGLYHTVEQNGTYDIIDDTAECPSNGTSAECPVPGNNYLMHWRVVKGDPVVTDGQGRVLLAHPLVQPPSSSGLSALALLPWPKVPAPTDPLPEGWCATCARPHE